MFIKLKKLILSKKMEKIEEMSSGDFYIFLIKYFKNDHELYQNMIKFMFSKNKNILNEKDLFLQDKLLVWYNLLKKESKFKFLKECNFFYDNPNLVSFFFKQIDDEYKSILLENYMINKKELFENNSKLISKNPGNFSGFFDMNYNLFEIMNSDRIKLHIIHNGEHYLKFILDIKNKNRTFDMNDPSYYEIFHLILKTCPTLKINSPEFVAALLESSFDNFRYDLFDKSDKFLKLVNNIIERCGREEMLEISKILKLKPKTQTFFENLYLQEKLSKKDSLNESPNVSSRKRL